jgi:TROVE domain
MSKFNRGTAAVAVNSPITSEVQPSGITFEGAPGYAREAKSELFLLAVSHLGENTFYESAGARDARLTGLVRQVATEDPAWMTGFTRWLRGDAQMRTSAVTVAADALKAMLDAGKPGGRKLISAALQRADEPGELLAYWRSAYGRKLPIALNRGISDAVQRLYTEFALLKYDSRDAALRFGDVVELVNPRYHNKEYGTWRDALYRYAIERRHDRGNEIPESLPMIRANAALRKRAAEDPSVLLDAAALKAAGMTWEDALSLAGNKVSKRDLWAALIPSMGFMAQLRNLRNFDDAGVPDEVAGDVIARLTDPEQVAKSRQFPFRFLSAYRAVPSLRWAYPLERALNLSLVNVPALKGRTLVLVDRSLSMWEAKMSGRSEMVWADAAAVFGAAVAQRADLADLVEFSSRSARVEFKAADSVLRIIERFHKGDSHDSPIGTGTDIPRAVREHLRADHCRVVLITDEQSEPGVLPSNVYGGYYGQADAMPPTRIDDLIPQSVPVYLWNIGGYRHGALPSGNGGRHLFGGLTDASFRMISLLEAGRDAAWPWTAGD